MALVNAADGTVVANYEYGPFGEVMIGVRHNILPIDGQR